MNELPEKVVQGVGDEKCHSVVEGNCVEEGPDISQYVADMCRDVDACIDTGEILGHQVSEGAMYRFSKAMRVVFATTMLSGCAGVPGTVSGVVRDQLGSINSTTVVERVVQAGVNRALYAAGPVGVAGSEMMQVIKAKHNAECATRAYEVLVRVTFEGGGELVHEGTEVRGSFSVLPIEEGGEEVQKAWVKHNGVMSPEEWDGGCSLDDLLHEQITHDLTIPSTTSLADTVFGSSGGHEADVLLSRAKDNGITFYKAVNGKVYAISFLKELPVEVPQYVGGVE